MHRDRLGLELTAASGEAARAFDDTVGAYVGFSREPGAPLKRALRADPAMPMALCLQGYFMHLMGLPELVAKARSTYESLKKTFRPEPTRAGAASLGRGNKGGARSGWWFGARVRRRPLCARPRFGSSPGKGKQFSLPLAYHPEADKQSKAEAAKFFGSVFK